MKSQIGRSIVALGAAAFIALAAPTSTAIAASAGDAQATQAAKLLMLLSLCTEHPRRLRAVAPKEETPPAPAPASMKISDEE
ncbi:hypothetical protein [Endothiovibrio diazotrophicus]